MAVWQFYFQLLPVEGENLSLRILDNCNSVDIFREELPQKQSWSKNIRLFGHDDKTCVEVFVCNAVIEKVLVRIDLRSITRKQLECIVKFAAVNHLRMSYNDGKSGNEIITGVTLENILSAVQASAAYAFVRNPHDFINSIHQSRVGNKNQT